MDSVSLTDRIKPNAAQMAATPAKVDGQSPDDAGDLFAQVLDDMPVVKTEVAPVPLPTQDTPPTAEPVITDAPEKEPITPVVVRAAPLLWPEAIEIPRVSDAAMPQEGVDTTAIVAVIATPQPVQPPPDEGAASLPIPEAPRSKHHAPPEREAEAIPAPDTSALPMAEPAVIRQPHDAVPEAAAPTETPEGTFVQTPSAKPATVEMPQNDNILRTIYPVEKDDVSVSATHEVPLAQQPRAQQISDVATPAATPLTPNTTLPMRDVAEGATTAAQIRMPSPQPIARETSVQEQSFLAQSAPLSPTAKPITTVKDIPAATVTPHAEQPHQTETPPSELPDVPALYPQPKAFVAQAENTETAPKVRGTERGAVPAVQTTMQSPQPQLETIAVETRIQDQSVHEGSTLPVHKEEHVVTVQAMPAANATVERATEPPQQTDMPAPKIPNTQPTERGASPMRHNQTPAQAQNVVTTATPFSPEKTTVVQIRVEVSAPAEPAEQLPVQNAQTMQRIAPITTPPMTEAVQMPDTATVQADLIGNQPAAIHTDEPAEPPKTDAAVSEITETPETPPESQPKAPNSDAQPDIPPTEPVIASAPPPQQEAMLDPVLSQPLAVEASATSRAVRAYAPATGPAETSVLRQVTESIRATPEGTMELALAPEELGKLKMSMHSSDGAMTVTIQAERAETLDLVRRNADGLARDLRDLGYTQISFAFGGQNGGQQQDAPAAATSFYMDTAEDPILPPQIRMATGSLDLRF